MGENLVYLIWTNLMVVFATLIRRVHKLGLHNTFDESLRLFHIHIIVDKFKEEKIENATLDTNAHI